VSNWRECVIKAEGIRTGELFKFRDLCVKAFQPAKFPKEAAVFTESAFGSEQVKFWVSPVAVQLLEKSGVDLGKWQARESAAPPRSHAAILAGHHQLAWELLPV